MRPPPPDRIATELEHAAKLLRTHGRTALRQAADYDATGHPTSTLGDGIRGNPELTSTEAAATQPDLHRQQHADLKLALRVLWGMSLRVQALITSVLGHADPTKVTAINTTGAGYCLACGRHVAGTANDRIRAGFCDGCRKAYQRECADADQQGQPRRTRAAFIRHRPPDTSSKLSPPRKARPVNPKKQVNGGA